MEKSNTINLREELESKVKELQNQLAETSRLEFQKETEPIKKIINKEIGDTYLCGVLINKEILFQILESMIINNKPIFLNYEIYKK